MSISTGAHGAEAGDARGDEVHRQLLAQPRAPLEAKVCRLTEGDGPVAASREVCSLLGLVAAGRIVSCLTVQQLSTTGVGGMWQRVLGVVLSGPARGLRGGQQAEVLVGVGDLVRG